MKLRPVLYLDTSIWRRLDDEENPRPRRITRRFLDRIGRRSELKISKFVMLEIRDIPFDGVRRKAMRKIRNWKPRIVTTSGRVHDVAVALMKAGCLSAKHLEDLYHIAYAVVGGAQFLVTWDKGDLARPGTREIVRRYCLNQGRHELIIDTPEGVAKWLNVTIGSWKS